MIASAEKYGAYGHGRPKRDQATLLEQARKRLDPPNEAELNEVMGSFLFGRNGEKMMKYAPWSFLLTKLMWKRGEEPWAGGVA